MEPGTETDVTEEARCGARSGSAARFLGDELNHFADVLKLLDLARGKADAEFSLDGHNELDVHQGVPVGNILRRGFGADDKIGSFKNILKYTGKFSLDWIHVVEQGVEKL